MKILTEEEIIEKVYTRNPCVKTQSDWIEPSIRYAIKLARKK